MPATYPNLIDSIGSTPLVRLNAMNTVQGTEVYAKLECRNPLFSVKDRIALIAKEVYGADGVDYSAEAEVALKRIQGDPELAGLGMCMVKTHLSLSDNPALKGVPTGWRLTIREVLTYGGAGFIVPVAGAISLMPGTGSNPAFKRVDVDVETGKVQGVF